MKRIAAMVGLGLVLLGSLHAYARNRWAIYEREMQDPVDDPPDADVDAEFVFGRLRYRSPLDGRGGRRRWGVDSNRGERQLFMAVRRLSLLSSDLRSNCERGRVRNQKRHQSNSGNSTSRGIKANVG